jgi:Rrf2 family protein
MPQLMAMLTRKGWVNSARGAGGGVRLAVDPKGITVQQVIALSGDPVLIKGCVSGDPACRKSSECPLFPVWARAQASIDAVMRGSTIADLVE